jgi:hypothetical protein
MIATRRNEFFALVARVVFLLGCGVEEDGLSLLEISTSGLESAPDWDKYGLDVKKCRFRGKLLAVVRWKERQGRGPLMEVCI